MYFILHSTPCNLRPLHLRPATSDTISSIHMIHAGVLSIFAFKITYNLHVKPHFCVWMVGFKKQALSYHAYVFDIASCILYM